MNTDFFKIAGGNITLLIEGNLFVGQTNISKNFLEKNIAEQVGFIDLKTKTPALKMMGDELCINATVAFAKKIGLEEGSLLASGIEDKVKYGNLSNETTEIVFTLPFIEEDNIVLFKSIGYLVINVFFKEEPFSFLRCLALKYRKPAFGLAQFVKGKLFPIVYVSETDTCIEETSCGSGSIATSIVTGQSNIVQTTNEVIKVKRIGDRFTVSAHVVNIGRKYESTNA